MKTRFQELYENQLTIGINGPGMAFQRAKDDYEHELYMEKEERDFKEAMKSVEPTSYYLS